MAKNAVVTDGEKLKAIRTKYKLKQSDLSGTDITRNLLSEIETGKAVITKNVAEVVIKNLKNIANKKDFKITETVEYLTENTAVQAKKILDSYISELKRLLISKDESFIETLKAAKSFLADWNVNEKAVLIYELAGDYYYIQNEMHESIMYYEKALTANGKLIPSNGLLQIFFKITKAYIHAGDYDKTIETSTFVIEHFDNLSSKDIVHLIYNRAYTYFLLNKYELAIADIGKIEKLVSKDDIQKYFMVLDTKAICLKKVNRYSEAIELYKSLLKVIKDDQLDKMLVLHINLTEAYMALSEIDKVNSEFNVVQQKLPFLNGGSKYEADIYFDVGNIYGYLKDVEKANKYYKLALDVAKKKKKYVLAADILYALIENTNSFETVENIKNDVFAISLKQERLADRLIHRLISFYVTNKDVLKIDEINNFALQFV